MADQTQAVNQAISKRIGQPMGFVKKNYTLDPFDFIINFLPIAASDTATNNFITQSDSGFAICKTSFTISDNVNVYVNNISDSPRYAPLTIMLTDSGSGRDLSNFPVTIGSLFGGDRLAYHWSVPKILDPNSTLTARLQNLVATPFNVRLVFHGYKIFGDVSQFRSQKV